MHESNVRRRARAAGFLLRKSRTRNPAADDYGLYVLVADSKGNRLPRAQAPISMFARGEGDTLEGVRLELANLGA